MRSSSIAFVAAAFMLACADAPTSTLLEPEGASMALGKAPPPWALIEGELTTDGGGTVLTSLSFSRSATDGAAVMTHGVSSTATYRAWLLVTPGGQATLLRFINDATTTARFSNGAMLSNVNGKVTGRGTMTVAGHTYELSAVTDFTADANCVTTGIYSGPGCATFSAPNEYFSSTGPSTWTGILSNGKGTPVPDVTNVTGQWTGTYSWNCGGTLTGSTPIAFSLNDPGTGRITGTASYLSGSSSLTFDSYRILQPVLRADGTWESGQLDANGMYVRLETSANANFVNNQFDGVIAADFNSISGSTLNGDSNFLIDGNSDFPRGCSAATGYSGSFSVTRVNLSIIGWD